MISENDFFFLQGVLTSAITYPRYRSNINTLQELFQSNLTLGIHNRHVRLFNRSIEPENKYYASVMNRIETINDEKNKEIIEERQFQYAVLMRKTEALYISRMTVNRQNGRPIFHVVPDCPVPCFIVYGLRYGSPYLNKIDNIIHHLHQGGISQFWAESEEQKGTQNKFGTENKEKPLNLGNVKEIFVVWSIGLLISIIVFFVEIIFYRHRNFVRHV